MSTDDAGPPPRVRGAGGADLALRPDLAAAHGPAPAGAEPVLRLDGDAVTVLRAGDAPPGAGPVYALPGGALAVPTGRVLVRFAEGTEAASHEAEIRGAGFRVEETLAYAPQAAWVAAESGAVADALRGAERLARLPGVEAVEPQMLMQRAARG